MTLYVDVDDTLVTWQGMGEHPYGAGAESWEVNVDVLSLIRWCEGEHSIVIWSGGGKDYAATWGLRLLNYVPHVAMAKNGTSPGRGDICVDDAPYNGWARRGAIVLHPKDVGDYLNVVD